jgi:hypothetical protein
MRLAIRIIEHKSGQTNFDTESLKQFKICEDLVEVSIMRSVPNWIFYLHEFSCNFSQHLAICFELFLFGSVFNSD